MADISQMTLPDGSVVNLKDSAGREALSTGLLEKVSIAQGVQNKGKILQVSNGGNLELVDPSTGSGDVTGPASSVNNQVAVFDGTTGKLIKDSGLTIGKSVPSDAVFTDTTYESKSAASGGTDESLVTTGEKYIWNNKTSNVGTVTGVKMNSGSSIEPDANGIVDLGTVITSHQDITGKADLVDGKVPSTQLPSYVDDVLEYASLESFPLTGEAGKIYIATDTNKTYRWSGSAYVEISESLSLGETSSTAYRGDRGKAAYDAAVANVDNTPTINSPHLITSGGVKAALPTTMAGASSSTPGARGLVPAPAAGDNTKVLMGSGAWEIAPGARIYVAETTVTNASGSYSATVQDENLTSDMIAMRIEMGTPGVFRNRITVSPGAGSYTITCPSVSGTSTLKVYFAKQQQNPLTITSTEFDILDNRLQAVENVRATVPLTIASTDWTLSNGVYSYTYTNSLLTENCAVDVQLQNGAKSAGISGFNVEKGTVGTLVFTTDETPTGNLPVIVEICNAKASDILSLTASDIYSEAISGCDTAEEALENLDGRVTALNSKIVYSESVAPSNPTLGMIWLKKKV